jgi:glutathione S-transferase
MWFQLPVLRLGETTISEAKKEAVCEGYDFLDKLLKNKKWIAGDNMTIADFSCVTTVSGLNVSELVLFCVLMPVFSTKIILYNFMLSVS